MGEDSVEVEGGREAEVEFVGEEGGALAELVVALAEGLKGEFRVREWEAQEGVWSSINMLAGVWEDKNQGRLTVASLPPPKTVLGVRLND